MKILNPASLDAQVKANGILYFLEDGHFLFRWLENKSWKSKFVRIEDVAASMTNTGSDTGWISEGVVRAGHSSRGDWFVYTQHACKHEIALTTPEGVTHITIPLPATVLIGVGSAYYLFAGAQYAPMGSDSQICRAPFPNVYDNGRICWGDNARPDADHKRAREVWELFFTSPFNNHLSKGKSQTCAADITEKLRTLAGEKKYPIDDLIKSNVSLEKQLKTVLDRDWRS